jgi:hypothetical protein
MEVFSFVFSQPLGLVDSCVEDSYEVFLSDFVKNVGDLAFEVLPVRDVVFGEFSFDISKKKSLGARSGP